MTALTSSMRLGDVDSRDDASQLILTLKGLVLVVAILEARGASEREIAEHRWAIERVRERLGQLVRTQLATAA
jgi:hypothetical protein